MYTSEYIFVIYTLSLCPTVFWVNKMFFVDSFGDFHSKIEGHQIYKAYDQSVPKTNTKHLLIKRKQVDKMKKIQYLVVI